MVLQTGQIKHLYMWVHPQWQPALCMTANDEMETYKDFLNYVRNDPDTAVMQIKGKSLDKDPYSLEVERRVNGLTNYMGPLMNGRYTEWSNGFFDAREPENVQKLRELLYLPEHIDEIKVFGKIVGLCPKVQAKGMGLERIARSVTLYPVETPDKLFK